MKTLALLLAGALALSSVPVQARDAEAGEHVHHPHISLGLGFGVPDYGPFWYDPWFYSPYYWYPPYAPYPRPPRQNQNASANLYVYPSAGQTEEQTKQDRSECHDWAVGQTKFDPATAKRREKARHMADFDRAFVACMEGRHYSVN